MQIGLGIGIPFKRNVILSAFNPSSLFKNNEPGVWLDPSDFSTMFQDAAGTTPVTAVEQPVGLILDKSKGLVLGSELVTNGDFSSGTAGWSSSITYTSTSSVVDGVFRVNSTTNYGLQLQPISCVVGRAYVITGQARRGTVMSAAIGVSANANGAVSIALATTTSADFVALRCQFVATSTIMYVVLGGSAGNPSGYHEYDNISVRELPGNHAIQTTSTSRPVLSARYNLLTKTEQFDDAVWVKTGATVTPNAAVAPDGTATADAVFETATTSSHFLRGGGNIPGPVNGTCTGRIRIKANGRNKVQVFVERVGASQWAGCTFNLSNNTYNSTPITSGGASFVSASIADDTDGFKIITVTGTPFVGSFLGNFLVCLLDDAASETVVAPSYAGDASKGIYIWGASLVPANQSSLPYQRVNTATDYDADPSKFKPYLRFDGVDDWLLTPTITPGTDKAQVFAGVRKLSDAVGGVVAEVSTSVETNSGSFVHAVGNVVGGYYGVLARGTAATSGSQAATTVAFVAPDTSVFTATHDIAGDLTIGRRNGAQYGAGTGDKGTGNFGNYPLYIGRRGGTTLPFNGNLYGLIVRFGANLPIDTIEKTEKFIANKTGITI